jgi:hypothetical protein
MVHSCCVNGCTKRADSHAYKKDKIYFFSIPKDPVERRIWLKAISRENLQPTAGTKVCSLHFQKRDFVTTCLNKRKDVACKMVTLKKKMLKVGVFPTIFKSKNVSNKKMEMPLDNSLTSMETTN